MLFGFYLLSSKCYAIEQENPTPNYDKISEQIADDVEKYHIPGMSVMVINKDDVLFQETYGNCSSIDTPFIIGSLSKSFTAVAIMQLVEESKIDLDSPIREYIDSTQWFADSADCDKITARELLNHTSGITTYQTFGELNRTDLHGQHIYANANYGILGLIVESVSGQSYEEYIANNIFKPLGMIHSAASLEKSEENGLISGYRNYFGIPVKGKSDYPKKITNGTWTNIPAGYLTSSASDMGKYLQMYLNDGDNILSKKSIDAMFYDNVSVDGGHCYYGMGWNYSTQMFSKPMLWHAGLVENFTSNMFVIPDEGIAVVVLVNMNDYFVANNLIGNIVNPLIGEERQDLPNLYVLLHFAINIICLVLCFVSIWSIATFKRCDKPQNKMRFYLINSIRHVVLPVILIGIPLIIGIPISVFWLFVKDLCVVFYANAIVLIVVGICKVMNKFCKDGN